MKKPTKRILKKKLDKLFSLFIRKRDKKCLKCGKTNTLQCAHLSSRRHLSGRWNEKNAITLCYSCHLFWAHKEPIQFAEWLKEKYPEYYKESLDIPNQYTKFTIEGLQLLVKKYQKRGE